MITLYKDNGEKTLEKESLDLNARKEKITRLIENHITRYII